MSLDNQDLNNTPEFFSSASGSVYLQRMKSMKSKDYYNISEVVRHTETLTEDNTNRFFTFAHKSGYIPYIRGFWRGKEGRIAADLSFDETDTDWYPLSNQVSAIHSMWIHNVDKGNVKMGYSFAGTGDSHDYEVLLYIYNQASV